MKMNKSFLAVEKLIEIEIRELGTIENITCWM